MHKEKEKGGLHVHKKAIRIKRVEKAMCQNSCTTIREGGWWKQTKRAIRNEKLRSEEQARCQNTGTHHPPLPFPLSPLRFSTPHPAQQKGSRGARGGATKGKQGRRGRAPKREEGSKGRATKGKQGSRGRATKGKQGRSIPPASRIFGRACGGAEPTVLVVDVVVREDTGGVRHGVVLVRPELERHVVDRHLVVRGDSVVACSLCVCVCVCVCVCACVCSER